MKAKKIVKAPDAWPRVTEIIGEIFPSYHLEKMKREDPEHLQALADNGTEFHEWAALAVTKKLDTFGPAFLGLQARDPEMSKAVINLIGWASVNIEKVIATEQAVFSTKYQYRGTCDLIAIVKGEKPPVVIDWKRRATVDEYEGRLQLAAYRFAATEMGLITGGDMGGIVRVPRDTNTPKADWFKNQKRDGEAFLCALALSRWKKAVK